MDVADSKKALRLELGLLRERISQASRREKNHEIARRLRETHAFQRAQTIHFYLSNPVEVETDALIHTALRLNKRVVFPVVETEGACLFFSELSVFDPEELETGPFGIRQPRPPFRKKRSLLEIHLWVLPGIGFDRRGNRLGYGKGYYDRVLHQIKKPTIGLAYDLQIVDRLPVESTDCPVDHVITETRIIGCKEIRNGRKDD